MDETHKQRIDFLCSETLPYASGAEVINDLTGEGFIKGSELHGRADLQTAFDPDRGFFVQPIFLIRDRSTGELTEYLRDDANPDRRPSVYAVEMSRRYPDGDTDSETVCYTRSRKQAEKYARNLSASL